MVPDGQRIVLGDANGTLRVLTFPSLKCVRTLAESAGLHDVLAAAFESCALAAAGDNVVVRFWNLASGAFLRASPALDARIKKLVISQDGLRVVGLCDDGVARMWDWDTVQVVDILGGREMNFNVFLLMPDRHHFLSATEFFDADAWSNVTFLKTHCYP